MPCLSLSKPLTWSCITISPVYHQEPLPFPTPLPPLTALASFQKELAYPLPLSSSLVFSERKHAIGVLAKPTFGRYLSFKRKISVLSAGVEPGQDVAAEEQQDGYRKSSGKENSDIDVADQGLMEVQQVLAAPMQNIKGPLSQLPELSGLRGGPTRRHVLGAFMFTSLAYAFDWGIQERDACALAPAIIDGTKAPIRPFDATDERLRDAAYIFEQALNASTVEEEERLWTLVIEKYNALKAEWVSDIVSRAYGNRGNACSRQGKLEQALQDYDKSISLAPYAVDPVLNRGVVLESLGRYAEASADYEAVLLAQPNDPAAWNNLGNAKAAESKWEEALTDYQKAVQLAPEFSFAAGNYALALYQVGRENEAVKHFRSLLRKYPKFPDVRAALAVSLYAVGLTAEAENNWERVEDGRYRDRSWVRYTRRWPPRLVNALELFLDVKSPIKS